jgi:hypothetical protein
MKTLSSGTTFFMKYVFTCGWITGFGLAMLENGHDAGMRSWDYPVSWAIGSVAIFWFFGRLKRVRVDDRWLFVSNYVSEIRLPLSMITDVTEMNAGMMNVRGGRRATVHFREPTKFGCNITFLPEGATGMSAGPVVTELKRMAVAARLSL